MDSLSGLKYEIFLSHFYSFIKLRLHLDALCFVSEPHSLYFLSLVLSHSTTRRQRTTDVWPGGERGYWHRCGWRHWQHYHQTAPFWLHPSSTASPNPESSTTPSSTAPFSLPQPSPIPSCNPNSTPACSFHPQFPPSSASLY